MGRFVVTKEMSLSSGHDDCPPVECEEPGQDKITLNGSPVCVQGAIWHEHGCDDHDSHKGVAEPSEAKVTIGGRPIVLLNDLLICPEEHRVIMADPFFDVG